MVRQSQAYAKVWLARANESWYYAPQRTWHHGLNPARTVLVTKLNHPLLLWLVLVLACGVLASCGEQTESAVLQPMQFAVDSTLLGSVVEDAALGLRFQPPRGWEAFSEDQVDSMRQATSGMGDMLLRPRYVFLHPEHGSVLTVSSLARDSSVTYAEQIASYEQALSGPLPAGAVKKAQFLKGNLPVTQFLIQTDAMVNFKLILQEAPGDLVQLDYLVPQSLYPQTARMLESSIGSIARYHEKTHSNQ